MENITIRSDILEESSYGYTPTMWICNLLLILFAVSTLAHVGQALYYRTWFMFITVIVAGILETVGWAARYWSSYEPLLETPFLMQIVTTIIGPTPLLAANFVILGEIIRRLGTEYSRLGPRLYTIIFCSFDFISLVIQAVGGAMASSANNDRAAADRGGNIMLGGIVFQLFTITVYMLLAIEFLVRFSKNRPLRASTGERPQHRGGAESPTGTFVDQVLFTPRIKLMVAALSFNTICLFIRAIYRTIELTDGWNGRIITTEVYFNVLDGAMIVLAIYTLNFFHPGLFIYRRHKINKDLDAEKA